MMHQAQSQKAFLDFNDSKLSVCKLYDGIIRNNLFPSFYHINIFSFVQQSLLREKYL